MRECAKTLDSLSIPPCGHRTRENGALVKVLASFQPDEAAAELCYSARDDTSIRIFAQQLTPCMESTV